MYHLLVFEGVRAKVQTRAPTEFAWDIRVTKSMPLITDKHLGSLRLNTMYNPSSSVVFSCTQRRGNIVAKSTASSCVNRKRIGGRHLCSLSLGLLAALANDLVLPLMCNRIAAK